MAMFDVKNNCETARTKLKEAIAKLELFLNQHALSQLNTENDPAMDEFYRGYLQDMRQLLVFGEVAYEKLGVSLRCPNFNVEYSERVLYEVS